MRDTTSQPLTRDGLPLDYYLQNALYVADWILEKHPALLNEDELATLNTFIALPKEAQCLYVRLLTRKGPYFRSDKLVYAEVPNLAATLELLNEQFTVAMPNSIPTDAFANLLTKPELAKCFPKLAKLNKQSMCEALASQSDEISISHLNSLNQPPLIIFRLHDNHWQVFRTLFFGNAHQDLTEFVLNDLGLVTFENYPVPASNSIWSSREALEEYLNLNSISDALTLHWESNRERDTALPLSTWHAMAGELTEIKRHDRAEARRQKFGLRVARAFERHEAWQDALALYATTPRPPSRERQARILEKLGENNKATELCQQMQDHPLSPQETEFALGRLSSKKSSRAAVWKQHTETLTLTSSPEGVEHDVALYFQNTGVHAWHLENGLIMSLFALSFWPVIFADVPGAFFHPFQRGPADLSDHDFLAKRETELNACWKTFESKKWQDVIEQRWAEKSGIANPFAYWPDIAWPIAELALSVVPKAHWRAMFERIWNNPKAHRNGLPDLLVIDTESNTYELVEVKGPGDQLQPNQKAWLRYFSDHDIPYRVIHVRRENG